jgi:FtsP/CotA-like multicopper oxidase with cupredoxin domain
MHFHQRGISRIVCLALVGAVFAAGCSSTAQTPQQPASSTPTKSAAERAAEIDKHHEEGIKMFPARTEGKGNQPLKHEMEGDTKVFNLSVSKIQWEVSPGKKVDAMAYNGQVPGPIVQVTEGDKVKVIVKNEMDESTAVHWHGLYIHNKHDGVPFITQPPVKPGETFTYEWVAKNPGSHMYHSHHNAVAQVTGGLLGALIINPKDPEEKNKYGESNDVVMIVNDGLLGYTEHPGERRTICLSITSPLI